MTGLGADTSVSTQIQSEASDAAAAEFEEEVTSGDPDAGEAANAAARAAVTTAATVAGAAGCTAVGLGAAALVCGAVAGAIADAIYGEVAGFVSDLFGGESEAHRIMREYRAAQSQVLAAEGYLLNVELYAGRLMRAVLPVLAAERRKLRLPPYSGWNDVMRAIGRYGAAIQPATTCDETGVQREFGWRQTTDPLTGTLFTEPVLSFPSWRCDYDKMVHDTNQRIEATVREVGGSRQTEIRRQLRTAASAEQLRIAQAVALEYNTWAEGFRVAAGMVLVANAAIRAAQIAEENARLFAARSKAARVQFERYSLQGLGAPPALAPVAQPWDQYTRGMSHTEVEQFYACRMVRKSAGAADNASLWGSCAGAVQGNLGKWLAIGAVGSAATWLVLRR